MYIIFRVNSINKLNFNLYLNIQYILNMKITLFKGPYKLKTGGSTCLLSNYLLLILTFNIKHIKTF